MIVANHLALMANYFDLSAIHGSAGRVAQACEKLGIPHWELPIDRAAALPVSFFTLVTTLRHIAPDVVILHGQWAGPVGALAARLAGIARMIYICHWPSFYSDWDIPRVIRNRICEAIPCRLSARVVTNSRGNWYQYLIRRLAPLEKLRIIHNGISPANLPAPSRRAEIRRQHQWDESLCHVVSVGRLADQKCVDWLLKSWRIVISQNRKAKLWIVGDGPDLQHLKQLASDLQIKDSCFFLGAQPSGIDYIAAADIVAMTTIYEGHANVPLEAMACGKPLVANDVDGVNDSFRDGVEGFLVPPGDVELFAKRLLKLIEDESLRKQMGESGKLRSEEFLLSKIVAQYCALIDEVLAEKVNFSHNPIPSA